MPPDSLGGLQANLLPSFPPSLRASSTHSSQAQGPCPTSLPDPAQLGASTPAQAHHPQDLCSRQGRSVMEALGPRRLVTSRPQPESELLLLQEHRPGLAPSHSLSWGTPTLPAWPKPLPGRAGLWSWVCSSCSQVMWGLIHLFISRMRRFSEGQGSAGIHLPCPHTRPCAPPFPLDSAPSTCSWKGLSPGRQL